MNSPLVTLTTDWGYKDFFAGMVKGRLYSSIPGVQVVDITHGIDPCNISAGSMVVKQACLQFPEGTIHIIDVDASETAEFAHVAFSYKGHYFICTDNGLPFMAFGEGVTDIVQLNLPQTSGFFNFAAYECFCTAAQLIAQGAPLDQLGVRTDSLYRKFNLKHLAGQNDLQVHIAYIDAYGNAYLDITYDQFEEIRNGRSFRLQVHDVQIDHIVRSYIDTPTTNSSNRQLVLTVSSTGMLELALTRGMADEMFGFRFTERLIFLFSPQR